MFMQTREQRDPRRCNMCGAIGSANGTLKLYWRECPDIRNSILETVFP